MPGNPRLGEILLDAHILKPEQIEQALAEQRRTGARFGETLIQLGFVQADDVNWGLAHQLGIPFVRVRSDLIEPEALTALPEETARRYMMVPYVVVDGRLTVVMEDPLNADAVQAARGASGMDVNAAVGLRDEIAQAIEACYGPPPVQMLDPKQIRTSLFAAGEISNLHGPNNAARLLDAILQRSVDMSASSLHWEAFGDRGEFRMRINGRLEACGEWTADWHRGFIDEVLARTTDAEISGPNREGLLDFNAVGRKHRFYVTVLQGRFGLNATLLNITCPDFPDTLAGLGLSEDTCTILLETVGGRSGFALLTGTEKMEKRKFAALLMQTKHAGEKSTFSFARMPWFDSEHYVQVKAPYEDTEALLRTLRTALAQEPDLLYVEGAWDRRLFAELVQTSLDRRYVFAGLSLPGALSGLGYALECMPNRSLLADALRGVVASAFFRRLCPHCREAEPDRARSARILGVGRSVVDASSVSRLVGCPRCRGGVTELVPVIEILKKDEALEEDLRSGADITEIRRRVLERGHRTLEMQVRDLVLSGDLTLDDYKMVERR